jgi:biotin synthase
MNKTFSKSLSLALSGAKPQVEWLVPLLSCSDEDTIDLYKAADEVREANVGNAVHFRALLECSSYCIKNCCYCGLRKANSTVSRYRLSEEEMIDGAKQAVELGYKSLVIQSGEDMWYTADRMAHIVSSIKKVADLAITLSLGERDKETYQKWFDAGADRYLLRIETTDPELFAFIHPDDDLNYRKQCLYNIRDIGYQLGTGVMQGIPGQTATTLANDVIWMHELGAEMIGVGPFIPHPETPLGKETGGTVNDTLRLVAVLRLVFPFAHLPATTAMGSLNPKGREMALQAGANVVMPNITPTTFRPQYEIYPGKICLGDDAAHCRGCITGRITSIGRTVGTDKGHVIRREKREE